MSTDQTPTPTRFLKNCEEVGLFNELASSFEHEFKKATDEDEKKVSVAREKSWQWLDSGYFHCALKFARLIKVWNHGVTSIKSDNTQ